MTGYQHEVDAGERFEFGKNWRKFLSVLNDERIEAAERSLCRFLGVEDLEGKTFLDIGSGSGLFSLAARRLGATVHSFDYDASSVACTRLLKERYYRDAPNWTISQGSVLDREFMQSLGQFDICYSWGVLHHTGSMWQALYNAHEAVASGGSLYIAIYNDQGIVSSIWELIKKVYCSGGLGTVILTPTVYSVFFLAGLAIDVFRLRNPIRRFTEHKRRYRGMSLIHDWKDWLGGYPFETATPRRITAYFENLGYDCREFELTKHGFGNNQFVFVKDRTRQHGNVPVPVPQGTSFAA